MDIPSDTASPELFVPPTSELSMAIDWSKIPDLFGKRLLSRVIQRCDYHADLLNKVSRSYQFWGNICVVLIPIGSALVTFCVSQPWGGAKLYISLLALLLSIVTILNSIYRPMENYLTSTQMLVRLTDWETQFLIGIERLTPKSGDSIQAFLASEDSKLSKLASEMADTFSPKDSHGAVKRSSSSAGVVQPPGKPKKGING